MKQRKLFAILTLVAFMMTLLPMAAFAAAPVVSTTTATASIIPGATTTLDVTLTEAAPAEIGVGNIVLKAPANTKFTNNAGNTVTPTATGTGITFGTIDYTDNAITVPVSTASTATGSVSIAGIDVTSTKTGSYAITVEANGLAATTFSTVSVAPLPTAGNEFTTVITKDETTVEADNNEEVKFTAYVYDQFYNPVYGATLYFASDRAAADTFVQSGTYVISGTGPVYSVTTTADGKAEVKVKSLVAGNAKIGFALNNATPPATDTIYNYLVGTSNLNVGSIQVVGTHDVEFTASSGSQNVDLQGVTVRDRTAATNIATGGTTVISGVTYHQPNGVWGKANKLDYYEVTVKVTNKQGAPVANQEVQFTLNNDNASLNNSKVTTDGSGLAKVRIFAEKAGNYVLTYRTSNSTAKEIGVIFNPGDVTNIVLKTADNRVIAKDTKPNWKFEVQDANGNKVDIVSNPSAASTIDAIDAITSPSGVTINKAAFDITADATEIKIQPKNSFTKVGTYKLRVALANGTYAEFNFEIKEQGTITAIKLTYPQSALPMNTVSGKAKVVWVDAAGVEKEADNTALASEGITLAANNYNMINGTINSNTGVFTTTNNKDFVGTLMIVATDNVNKLTSTYEIEIGRQLASMTVAVPTEKAVVGETIAVPVKFIDINGKQVAAGDVSVEVVNAYPLSKPADAIATIETGSNFAKNVKEKGEAVFNVKSNMAGDVTYFVTVKVNGNNYVQQFTVNFGAPKAEVPGANKVTLFIGQQVAVVDGDASVLDVAPFIKDGRTFVPVRFIAEALGADVKYDAATQTVTATRGDDVVVLTIGSNVMTVNGEAQVTDVAPFIVDGRTVLPFRALAEAFGSEVAWDAATQSVVFEK